MKKNRFFITLILVNLTVTNIVHTQVNDEDYIDPTDLLNFDPIKMRMKKDSDEVSTNNIPEPGATPTDSPTTRSLAEDNVSKELNTQTTESCSADAKLNIIAISLLRQYAQVLVNHLENKIFSNSPSNIYLRLGISRHDIFKLKQFGQEKTSDIRDIHDILRYIIQDASDVLPQESNLHWLETRIGLSWPMMLQTLAIILCLIVLLKVLQQTFISRGFIFRMLFLLFVISVIFAWLEMYQEKLADQERQFMETLGKACQKPEDQSFFNRAFLFVSSQFAFKNDKCQEYYQNIFVNPILKVSPMEAIAVAVVKTVVAPIGIIGKAMSTFLTELLKDLPVHYQLAVSCVLPVLVVLALCIWRGYQLNLFHLVSIGPGHQPVTRHPPVEHQTVQVQHTVAPAIASAPGYSQVHLVQNESLRSVNDLRRNERVPQRSAVHMQSLNTAQQVSAQQLSAQQVTIQRVSAQQVSAQQVLKHQNQMQQRSQVNTERESEPREIDPIARGEPGPGLGDGDHDDIRQQLAQVRISQDVEIKQQEVERQLQHLVISDNFLMQNNTASREISADNILKESHDKESHDKEPHDKNQSAEEKSMTNILQEATSTGEPSANESSLRSAEISDKKHFDKRTKVTAESSLNVRVKKSSLNVRVKKTSEKSDTGETTIDPDTRETSQELCAADEDFVVVKEEDVKVK